MTEYNVSTEKLIEMDRECLWHHITQHKTFESKEPPIMVEGHGAYVRDVHGREYLDALAGGVWCVNAGYGRSSIAEAVHKQLLQLPYYAGSAGNPPAILLAKKLTELLPHFQRVYLSNSGSEANEKAFKISRQYNRLVHPKQDKYKILYRERDYHGTTLGALSATGQGERTKGYEPLVPGFAGIPPVYCYRCPFNKNYPGCNLECAHALEDVIQKEGPDSVGALILEPITAGGGIIIPVDEYFSVIQEICRKYEVLLIVDEVVTGFGRTGKAFGHSHWDVKPDILTTAKGITSSYMPLSATITTEELFNAFKHEPQQHLDYFRDISTFGGSAGACAAALENIKIIEEEELILNSARIGNYLANRLREFADLPMIGDVRGKGLFIGIELVTDKQSKAPASEAYMAEVVGKVAAEGVLIGKMNRSVPGHNNVLTIAPPLILTQNEAARIADAIQKALESMK